MSRIAPRIYKTSGSSTWRIRDDKLFCIGNYLPTDNDGNPVFLGEILGDIKSLAPNELKEKLRGVHFEAYRPAAIGALRVLNEIAKGDYIVATLPGRRIRIYRVVSDDIVYRRLAENPEQARIMLRRREPWEEFCIEIEPVKEVEVDDILYSKLAPRMTISRVRDKIVRNKLLEIIKN